MSDNVDYKVESQECEWGCKFQALNEVELSGIVYHKGADIPYKTQQEFRILRHLVEHGVVAKAKRR